MTWKIHYADSMTILEKDGTTEYDWQSEVVNLADDLNLVSEHAKSTHPKAVRIMVERNPVIVNPLDRFQYDWCKAEIL